MHARPCLAAVSAQHISSPQPKGKRDSQQGAEICTRQVHVMQGFLKGSGLRLRKHGKGSRTCLEPPNEGLVGEEQVTLLPPHAHGLKTPLDGVFESSLASLVPPIALVVGCSVRLNLHAAPIQLCKCVSVALCCHHLEQKHCSSAVGSGYGDHHA